MKEPKFRYVTLKAIEELSADLGFEISDDKQDWEFIIGNPDDIEKYINHYKSETNEDKKFALMEIIIQALTDQKEENFIKYWNIVITFLQENFKIHEHSIFYWSSFDNEDVDDCWQVTPLMRSLWTERNTNKD